MSRIHFSRVLLVLLALAICTGTMQAAITIVTVAPASQTTLALSCDLGGSPNAPANVNINLASGSSALSVVATAPLLPAILPNAATLSVTSSTSTTGTVFAFRVPQGCAGVTSSGMQVPITFTPGGIAGNAITVTATITLTGNNITTFPGNAAASAITLTCDMASGPGAAQGVGIALSYGSTPVSVTASAALANMQITTATQSVTSSGSATIFNFRAPAGCAGVSSGTPFQLTFTPAAPGTPIHVNATINVTGSLITTFPGNAAASAITLTCNAATGVSTTGNIGIALSSGNTSNSVTVTSPLNGLVITPSATQSVTSSSAATAFTFAAPAGCAGVTSGQPFALTFTPTGLGSPVTVNATINVTGSLIKISPSLTTISLACNVLSGPGATVPVGIELSSGNTPISVTAASTGNAVITPSATQTVNSSSSPTIFYFQAPSCASLTSAPAAQTITFTPAGVGGTVSLSATTALSGSYVSVTPSTAAVSCIKGGAVTSASMSVTSSAAGGSHYYVSATNWPTWLTTLSNPNPGTSSSMVNATSAPTVFALTPTSCALANVGTYGYNVSVIDSLGVTQTVAVTLTVGAADPVTATPAPVPLTYTKAGSGAAVANATAVTLHNANAPSAVFYTLDSTTLPSWLIVDIPSASFTTATKTLQFTPTSACAALAVGSYSAAVHFKVTGAVDLVVNVNLLVQNPGANLSLVEGTSKTITWVSGSPILPFTLTPVSSQEPIEYNVTFSGIIYSVTPSYGIAYSFGSPITVQLDASQLNGFAPSTTPHTGTVTFTPTGNAGSPMNFTVSLIVQAPGAIITSIFPQAFPVASSGTFYATITGSGFVKNTLDATQQTKLGVVSSGFIVTDSAITYNVVNSTTITIAITVPTGDPFLPFNSTNTVWIGVCNPNGIGCSAPTQVSSVVVGQVSLMIGSVPIIQAVTSASSYKQATPPAHPNVAPYDVLSIFGTNFCMSGATGCTGANATLYGVLNPATLQYSNQLSPDNGTDNVTVTFQTHSNSPTVIGAEGAAPLLFATNNQINVLVPAAVSNYVGQLIDIVVSYGPASTTNTSLPYSVMVAATDPGVFTIGGDGAGPAAALDSSYHLITSANPAGFGADGTSDTITLYVTGLGKPDTDGASATGWPSGSKCITTAAYYALVAATGTDPLNNDGVVQQSALYGPAGDIYPPCFMSTDSPASSNLPIVKIGNVAGTITYAGWAPDSVAGLYQIDVQLPGAISNLQDTTGANITGYTGLAAGMKLPVVVSSNNVFSQTSGVTLDVAGRLKVTAPTIVTGSGGGSTPWPGNAFTITGGGPGASYTFTTADVVPGSLVIDTTGQPGGTVSQAPGDYTVHYTVTDSVTGFTGTVTVTWHITA